MAVCASFCFCFIAKLTLRLQDIFNTLKESGEPAIPNFSDLINPSIPKVDMNELWEVQLKKWKFQCDYLEHIRAFESKVGGELDAIIAPITPTAAIRHDQFKYYGYASAINLLDYTSVIVPVTFADKAVDVRNGSFKPISDMDATVQAECTCNPAREETWRGSIVADIVF